MSVEVGELRKLVDIPLDKGDADLQPFITIANLLVTENLASKGLSDDRLTAIGLFLAAHFTTIGIEHGGLARWGIDRNIEYYKEIDPKIQGLGSTHWGQQAMMLDTSGTLSQLTAEKRALFKVIPRNDVTTPPGW